MGDGPEDVRPVAEVAAGIPGEAAPVVGEGDLQDGDGVAVSVQRVGDAEADALRPGRDGVDGEQDDVVPDDDVGQSLAGTERLVGVDPVGEVVEDDGGGVGGEPDDDELGVPQGDEPDRV